LKAVDSGDVLFDEEEVDADLEKYQQDLSDDDEN